MHNSAAAKGQLVGVLYCSRVTNEMSSDDLEKILRTSQLNNSRRRITGVLVCGGGMFMQWVEGPQNEVRKLMASIALDPRHQAMLRLCPMIELDRRLYPSWAMESLATDEIRNCFSDCLSVIRDSSDRRLILDMVKLFETSEYQTDQPKFDNNASPDAAPGLKDLNGMSSMVKYLLHKDSKKFMFSRLLSFL